MMEFLSKAWDFIWDAIVHIFVWIVCIAMIYGFIRALYDGIKRHQSLEDDD